MDTKSKQGQKGSESHGKQATRPGSEQTRSGSSMERQSERQPEPVTQQKQKEKVGQSRKGKK